MLLSGSYRNKFEKNVYIFCLYLPTHNMILEWWNTTKGVSNIWQYFSCLLDKETAKIYKKFNSHESILKADHGRAKNCCQISWIGCHILQVLSSKSQCEISISYIFLQSPHQVDMKNVVKWWKEFNLYFTILETYHVIRWKSYKKKLIKMTFYECFEHRKSKTIPQKSEKRLLNTIVKTLMCLVSFSAEQSLDGWFFS